MENLNIHELKEINGGMAVIGFSIALTMAIADFCAGFKAGSS